MGVARGMEQACSRVGNVSRDRRELEAVHEPDRLISAALYGKRHYAAGAVGQVLFGKLVVLVALEVGIVDPRHLILLAEELGDLLRVLAVSVHANMKALKAVVEIERILR